MAALRDSLLVGTNAVMAGVLLGLVLWPLPEPQGLGPATPPPAPATLALAPPSQSNAVLDPHPVFWPRPAPPPSTAMPAEVKADPVAHPMPRLVGLVVRRGIGLAVFEVPGERETRTLGEGEVVAGWVLEKVYTRSVRLEQNGHRVVVSLDPGAIP